MSQVLVILLFGALGGILRGILGIGKTLVLKDRVEINYVWLFISIAASAVLGMLAALFFLDDYRLALAGGYAGSDFLEGLAKILLKERFDPKKQKIKKSKFGVLLKKKV
jgi:hypothetical protein